MACISETDSTETKNFFIVLLVNVGRKNERASLLTIWAIAKIATSNFKKLDKKPDFSFACSFVSLKSML